MALERKPSHTICSFVNWVQLNLRCTQLTKKENKPNSKETDFLYAYIEESCTLKSFRQAASVKQINGLIIATCRRFLSKGFTAGTSNELTYRTEK